ncbi:MAG: hypothetical protein SFT68_04630 [Rickettsiaceae bacterium]|nr:hypothetical protein [Rickettsiaceae bacterium]
MRKEVKKYYHEDKLNRGYKKHSDNNTDKEAQFEPSTNSDFLIPIEVMMRYEEFLPGSFEKILKLAHQEQEKKFQLEKIAIEANYKITRMSKLFGIFVLIFIGFTAISLAEESIVLALIFNLLSFGVIGYLSYLSYKDTIKDLDYRRTKQKDGFKKNTKNNKSEKKKLFVKNF